jgi:transcriptional regulator GlxA family with amidase domain
MCPRAHAAVMVSPHRVSMVAFDDAQILDIVGPLEVFSRAARLISDEGRRGPLPYTVEVLARHAGPITTSCGIAIVAARSYRSVRAGIETLVVSGGRGVQPALADRQLIAWLRRMAPRVKRLASVCTGAFVLAEAGLLDGKRAATHWRSCDALASRYPEVDVDPEPIFVKQGRIFTSAGVTAGMDLALALVEEDHGSDVARAVARELVLFLKRPGGQAQFSMQLRTQVADRPALTELSDWIADHLAADLSVPALARRAAMSPRTFARSFVRSFGTTPARYVEGARVEAARRRLEESDANVDRIAGECGFGHREAMRRAFQKTLRVSPSEYRERFAR